MHGSHLHFAPLYFPARPLAFAVASRFVFRHFEANLFASCCVVCARRSDQRGGNRSLVGRKKGESEEASTKRPREGWGPTLSFGTARAAVGARMAKLLHGSSKCAQAARPAGVIAAHSAQTIRGGGLVHFYACQRTLCRAFDVCVRFWGVVVRARGATRPSVRRRVARGQGTTAQHSRQMVNKALTQPPTGCFRW